MTAADPNQPHAEEQELLVTSRFKDVLVALALVCISGHAFACGDPSEVSELYYSAIIEGDFTTSAKMFHPEGISKLRSRLDFVYDSDDEKLENFWPLFGEDADSATVESMSDQEFFEVLHALMAKQSTVGDFMHIRAYEVLGTVMEGDKTAHVLVRVHTTLTKEGKASPFLKNKADVYFDVQSMRCSNGKWLIEKDDGVDGLVLALEGQRDFDAQRDASDEGQ